MKDKTKPAIAINLKAIRCPKCNTLQPQFRFPQTWRQFFFGGWRCKICNTDMDQFGKMVF